MWTRKRDYKEEWIQTHKIQYDLEDFLLQKIQINIMKAPAQWRWKLTFIIWAILLGKEYLLGEKNRVKCHMPPDTENNQTIYLLHFSFSWVIIVAFLSVNDHMN